MCRKQKFQEIPEFQEFQTGFHFSGPTNLVESGFSVVRQVSKNVKRWGNDRMAALGLIEAEKRFRKIRGYRHLPMLGDALQKREKVLDKSAVA